MAAKIKPAPFSDAGGHGRQASTSLDSLSPDHYQRYVWAAQILSTIRLQDGLCAYRPALIVDAGCGVGYGSYIMAEGIVATGGTGIICGFDIEPSAIEHAETHFAHDNIEYAVADAGTFFNESPLTPDVAVAFEMIEHIDAPDVFLRGLSKSGAQLLLASVPNEEEYHFVSDGTDGRRAGHIPTGHKRHYTPAEFESLLLESGWRPVGRFGQKSKADPVVRPGWYGRTILVLAVPVPGGVDEP